MFCKLCQNEQSIKNSHIVPRFVSQWIKETSSLNGLRDADKPNLRLEDTPKHPLLCTDCETRLSVWEGDFAKRIFLPFNDVGDLEFSYENWLLSFAVALSWRVGHSLLDGLRMKQAILVPKVEQALQIWRSFLLGERANTQPYCHHLFFDTMVSSRMFVGYAYDYRYAHRTIDCAIPYGVEEIAIYIKLPSMTFYSPINPTDPDGFKGTRIMRVGTVETLQQEVTNPFFWSYMQDSAKELVTSMVSMSDKQQRKLQGRMLTAKPEWQIRQEREQA